MTLMELMVATILVGIVMVGTVSVDFAVHSIRKTTADGATLALQTSAAMLDITTNMAKAVGDAQSLGVETDNPACTVAAPCRLWFCGRQDTDNDPNTYTGDVWTCYWKPNSTTDPNIYKYTRTAAQGAGACTGACTTATAEIIGAAACKVANCTSYHFEFSLTNNPATRRFSFDLTLKNRAYPLQQVNPAQPLKNPEYELSSHVTPMGHSY